MVKDHVKITLIPVILTLMLSGTVLSSTLVGTSHAQKSPTFSGPPPPGTGIALAQQSKDVLTGLSVGKDGAMYVTFKVGIGKWSSVGITQKGIFPPGANIAMAKQTDSLLVATAIGNNGAMYVLWTGPRGWNSAPCCSSGPGPYPPHQITPSGIFDPGADIAMVKQTNNRLTAWAVGKDGSLYQSWVDDPRWVYLNSNDNYEWNKPVYTRQGEKVSYPHEPIRICCIASLSNNGIAAHKQTNNMLTVLSVDYYGALSRIQIDRLCNSEFCPYQVPDKVAVSLPLKESKQIGPKNLFPRGGDIAMAPQLDNQLTALTVGNDGALYVLWAIGGGEWNGPVGITPPKIFPPGAAITMAKQTKDVLTALAVGNDGALYRSWVVGGDVWNKPPPGTFATPPFSPQAISPKGMFQPGAGVAMTYFSGAGATEALTVGKDGVPYVSWVAGTGKWNGPVKIS